ncbi:MAG: MBL fold metallo-hydrolase [Nitrososphaerota archaeon]|nr:MBL fold metallo-hydrolase [Nitrososphaerota archaeon]MDG6903482.1 MBL fold metallo-hydrolase [Nitrososphaerota archaeon]MDG6912043.1 MBL fold metallo-hydrolase [Nitrososphaerota archaeon]MDG6924775.1 MBL fold metallo-hydrolase [Nitrososphaerota archaeon]MDG6940862.1 MBL fold metallo-hydrolase [Nitrososphaerota archaeon]
MWTYEGVRVHWLGHDGFVLSGSKTVILDPFKAKGDYRADVLLITHEHFDHLSDEDIRKFVTAAATIVAPKMCEEPLKAYKQEKLFVNPGSTVVAKGVKIEAIPAYNLNKFREPGKVFHPKEDGRVGYIVTIDGVRFYHAGDSDATPELKSVDVDVAFLPVSGTYVMTAEEAAGAAKGMKAKVVVPMHFQSIVGTKADAERFKQLVGASKAVEILEQE